MCTFLWSFVCVKSIKRYIKMYDWNDYIHSIKFNKTYNSIKGNMEVGLFYWKCVHYSSPFASSLFLGQSVR